MDLGEFNGAKPVLRILVPVSLVLVAISVRDFLAVRALGMVGLMVASPLLEAAFLKDPSSRLLVPIYAYALLTVSLFWVGMPYLFRDAVTWATADQKRWTMLSLAGLGYGVATLVCALAFWRAYLTHPSGVYCPRGCRESCAKTPSVNGRAGSVRRRRYRCYLWPCWRISPCFHQRSACHGPCQ